MRFRKQAPRREAVYMRARAQLSNEDCIYTLEVFNEDTYILYVSCAVESVSKL